MKQSELAFGVEILDVRIDFNTKPIQGNDVFTNVITPLIQSHNVAVGGTLGLGCNVDINAAYVYLIENTKTGPLPSPPFGLGDTISSTLSAHSAILGVAVRY